MPKLSPDGKTIYFIGRHVIDPPEGVSDPYSDRDAIYSVPTKGGEATRLPIDWLNSAGSPGYIEGFALSHDGSTFALGVASGILTVPVGGGVPTKVADDSCGYAYHPSFSPDDQTIVYTAYVSSGANCSGTLHRTIYTTPANNDGTSPGTLLFPEDATDPSTFDDDRYWPTYSPDGKYIAFANQLGGLTGTDYLATVPATGGSVRNITPCSFCRPVWTEKLPDTFIDSGPSGYVKSTSANFSFSSDQSDATFQCKLDYGIFGSCTSPKTVPNEGALAEGTHTFQVRAFETSGGGDLTPASRTWTVDTTPPAAPVINGPANNSFDTDGNITLSGTAEAGSTVKLFDGTTSKGTTQADSSGVWSKTLSAVSQGTHTYTAKGTDAANNTSDPSNTLKVTVDTTRPTVKSTMPLSGATGVGKGISPTATFSEKVMASSINVNTFKLYKVKADGTQTQISNVVVTLSSDGLTAKLNPFGSTTTVLASKTKYKGVVTTGTMDLAGNSLAQQMSWTFTTQP